MKYCFTHVCKQTVLIIILVSLANSVSLFAQKNDLIIKAQELLYSNPDEAIKIGEHILKIAANPESKIRPNLLLTRGYLVKGDYDKAVTFAFNSANNLPNISLPTRIEINLIKSEVLRKLYLDKQAKKYLQLATDLIVSLPANTRKDSLNTHIAIEQIKMLLDRRKNEEALQTIQDVQNTYKTFLSTNKLEQRELYLAKERAFSDLTKFDSAVVYMNKTLVLLDSTLPNNLYKKAEIYKELGNLYLQQKAFKDSEETLFIALRFSEIINNPILLMQVNRDLAINYLATNQKNQHKVYNDEFLVLNTQVELNEQNAINTVFNMLSKYEDIKIEQAENKYTNALYILLSGG